MSSFLSVLLHIPRFVILNTVIPKYINWTMIFFLFDYVHQHRSYSFHISHSFLFIFHLLTDRFTETFFNITSRERLFDILIEPPASLDVQKIQKTSSIFLLLNIFCAPMIMFVRLGYLINVTKTQCLCYKCFVQLPNSSHLTGR